MIKSFGDKSTEKIWNGNFAKKIPINAQKIGRRKLRMINNAESINDLRIPPANRLEKLKGTLKSFHSVRINNQWRVIFKWEGNHAYQVQIVDYH